MTTDRRIATFTIALVLLLTALSFALSYDNLRFLAIQHGKAGWRGDVWPLLIDGSLIVFALVVVYQSRRKRSTKLARALVVSFTAATIYFNVASYLTAIPDGINFILVAVSAPLVLYFSFETLMDMLQAVSAPASSAPGAQSAIRESQTKSQSDALAPAKSQSESHACPNAGCVRTFPTPQGVSAHLRYCEYERVRRNGKEKIR